MVTCRLIKTVNKRQQALLFFIQKIAEKRHIIRQESLGWITDAKA